MLLRLPRPGEVIGGQFVLRREIGRGAMGVVYEATQTGLERRVALKILHPKALVNDGVIERFQREARLACTLTHPNTTAIYSFGLHHTADDDEDNEGLPYIVMEYLEGQDLQTYLDHKKTLPLDEALEIIRQILACLQVAHKRGLVHRDLKPHNIFLCDTDEPEGFAVKVLDFGLARAIDGEWAGSMTRRLTAPGVVCGTPEYMAPEQATAEWDQTTAVDTYALGCLLYQLLTGEPPFTGTNPLEIAAQHVTQPPDPLPEPFRGSLIELILFRALAKHPRERFQDATEFALAIEEVGVDQAGIKAWKVDVPEWALATVEAMPHITPAQLLGNDTPQEEDGHGGVRDTILDLYEEAVWKNAQGPQMRVEVNAATDIHETTPSMAPVKRPGPTLTQGIGELLSDDDYRDTNPDGTPLPARPVVYDLPSRRSIGPEDGIRALEQELNVPDEGAIKTLPPDEARAVVQQRRPTVDSDVPAETTKKTPPEKKPRKRRTQSKGSGAVLLLLGVGWLVVALIASVGILVFHSQTGQERGVVELQVDTTPSGAIVYEEGNALGLTPITIRRAQSDKELQLTFKKEGFFDQVAVVSLSDGSELNFELEPR